MRRAPVIAAALSLAAAVAVPAGPATAGPASACVFDEETARLDITLVGNPNVLFRSGDDIELNGGVACTGATVFNTDLIVATADGSTPDATQVGLVIDLSTGRFAPGKTDEGSGSEIEIDVRFAAHWPNGLTINAHKGGQWIAIDELGIDLDADEPAPENDVAVSGPLDCDASVCEQLVVRTGDGADRIEEWNDLAAPRRQVVIHAGHGDDLVLAHSSQRTPSFLEGGAGNDTLRTDGDAHVRGGPGNDLLVGGSEPGHRDDLTGGSGFDVIFGRRGADVIYGVGDRDTIVGGRGGDLLNGGTGRDRIWGGPGRDVIEGDFGFDACELEAGWTLHAQGCERELFLPPPAL